MTLSTSTGRREDRPSIGELVSAVSEKFSTLIRDEIRLIKAEMTAKARNAGIGIGLFVGAGVLTFWAVAVLLAAAVLGLANALPAWLAALIIGLAVLLVAGIMIAIGVRAVKKASPPTPERAQASIKADVEAVRAGLSSTEGTP